MFSDVICQLKSEKNLYHLPSHLFRRTKLLCSEEEMFKANDVGDRQFQ